MSQDAPTPPTVEALSELFGGLQLIDSDLELDSGTRVDHVAIDSNGRLVLVLPVSGRGTSSLAATLDLIAYVRSHGDVLHRAYLGPRTLPTPARLVVLAEHFEDDVRRRLAALAPCGLELVQLGALRSARGERLFAQALEGAAGREVAAAAPAEDALDLDSLLGSLPEDSADSVRAVVRRIERLDDSLELRPVRDGFAWYQGDGMLARVELRPDGDVLGIVPGRTSRSLRSRQGVETFLDGAVAAFVEQSEGESGETL